MEEKHGSSDYVSRGQTSSQAPGFLSDWRSGSNFFQKKRNWEAVGSGNSVSTSLGSPRSPRHTGLGEFSGSQEPQMGYFRNQNQHAQNLFVGASGGRHPPRVSDPPGRRQWLSHHRRCSVPLAAPLLPAVPEQRSGASLRSRGIGLCPASRKLHSRNKTFLPRSCCSTADPKPRTTSPTDPRPKSDRRALA